MRHRTILFSNPMRVTDLIFHLFRELWSNGMRFSTCTYIMYLESFADCALVLFVDKTACAEFVETPILDV